MYRNEELHSSISSTYFLLFIVIVLFIVAIIVVFTMTGDDTIDNSEDVNLTIVSTSLGDFSSYKFTNSLIQSNNGNFMTSVNSTPGFYPSDLVLPRRWDFDGLYLSFVENDLRYYIGVMNNVAILDTNVNNAQQFIFDQFNFYIVTSTGLIYKLIGVDNYITFIQVSSIPYNQTDSYVIIS